MYPISFKGLKKRGNTRMIYLDNAATTKVREEVLKAMYPYFTEIYCNPSAVYTFAEKGKEAISIAQRNAAELLCAKPSEIYFTSGGTESDNWAIKSVVEMYREKGKHIITSKIEHHAVLHTCEYLEKHGYEITYLDVDEYGTVNPQSVRDAIRPDTILVSVMAANNEIGTMEPIGEIGRIAHERGALFHTDAVQAYGHTMIDVNEMNIDLLSASGHKFGGPKGVGILYVRKGVRLCPLMHGGSQERGMRAGTSNVAGIVGFGKAAELAGESLTKRMECERLLRDRLIERVLSEIPGSRLNGHRTQRLCGNTNFSFDGVEGESVLVLLDALGICASSGSACTSGSLDPSHVLLATGLTKTLARSSLRLTLSDENTVEEIDYTVDELKKIITGLREKSRLN